MFNSSIVSCADKSDLSSVAVLIPCWKPEPVLIALVVALAKCGFGAFVIVDDGNSTVCAPLFASLGNLPRVCLLRHAVNCGKGRALKTGYRHILEAMPSITIVVTADADGQHAARDIVRVAEQAQLSGTALTLGARSFGQDVPVRSRFGNLLTVSIVALATGVYLNDTQTGLRALPRGSLEQVVILDGERYEYEMSALIHFCHRTSRPLEVPIQTIYFQSNRSSHFRPLRDSIRIYKVLLRALLERNVWRRRLQ